MDELTMKKAKSMGLRRYFTGRACPHGHVVERFVSTRACVDCIADKSKMWKMNNPEKHARQGREWNRRNPEWRRRLKLVSQKRNRDSANRRQRKWYAANKEQANAASVAWQRRNPGRVAATAMRRVAARLRATPKWANAAKITRAYELAAEYRARGINAEVDHVVPLQGKTVCGLHVHDNLQIISGTANRSKSNRMKGD